jgi:hypothetical protein
MDTGGVIKTGESGSHRKASDWTRVPHLCRSIAGTQLSEKEGISASEGYYKDVS